jgi:ribosome-binding factor A
MGVFLAFCSLYTTFNLRLKVGCISEKPKYIWFFSRFTLPLSPKKKEKTMQETRQNKIARLLQKELSVIFQEQTRGMHGVMVSVTRVRVSPDLSVCTAHLSIFPSERGEEIMANINKNDKQIRYELGTRVRHQLRIIPELRFFIDDSLDYIDHIDELLKK